MLLITAAAAAAIAATLTTYSMSNQKAEGLNDMIKPSTDVVSNTEVKVQPEQLPQPTQCFPTDLANQIVPCSTSQIRQISQISMPDFDEFEEVSPKKTRINNLDLMPLYKSTVIRQLYIPMNSQTSGCIQRFLKELKSEGICFVTQTIVTYSPEDSYLNVKFFNTIRRQRIEKVLNDSMLKVLVKRR